MCLAYISAKNISCIVQEKQAHHCSAAAIRQQHFTPYNPITILWALFSHFILVSIFFVLNIVNVVIFFFFVLSLSYSYIVSHFVLLFVVDLILTQQFKECILIMSVVMYVKIFMRLFDTANTETIRDNSKNNNNNKDELASLARCRCRAICRSADDMPSRRQKRHTQKTKRITAQPHNEMALKCEMSSLNCNY